MNNKLLQGLFTQRVVVTASSAVATSALLLSAPQPALAQQGSLLATPQSLAAQRQPRSVTLITGDRVVVGGEDLETVNIKRAPGRERVNFSVQRVTPARGQRAHLLVIPEDAAALVQAGKVDRRLFDISLLIEFNYDDAHRTTLPFIVAFAAGGTAGIVAQPPAITGAVIEKDLSSVNGVAASAAKAGVGRVWSSVLASAAPAGSAARAAVSQPIAKIWLDGLQQPLLDRSVAQIGAPAAWDLGFEGAGVIVGVLDTGIDDTHPDLVDNVLARANFTVEEDVDLVGHGTHVASIIAGSGAASGGLYRGVAPAAQLLSGKVCEEFGCPDSSIIAGMEWAVADQGAQVVNMSLGGGDALGLDPIEEAVNTLSSEYGALFVIAAGNSGPFPSSVESPGATSPALTVGAVDHDDVLAVFSSTGFTLDQRIKPDLTAPGVDIVAARATGTEIGTLVGDDYVTLSGTSMATPHAAGSVALLLDAHPEWTPAEAKAALTSSAVFNPEYSALQQGAGRIDVAAALGTSFFASATSLSFGVARWPHEDDTPITRTVTYRNRGPAAELTFEVDVVGPEGVRPPAGLFTISPASASVPENGSVSVRVTANTSVGAADGVYTGRLIASDGASRSLALTLAVNQEVESYDLTVRHLDRQGAPTSGWFSTLIAYESDIFQWVESPDPDFPQDVTVRLPKGRYAFESYIFGQDFVDARVVAPNQLLDRDLLLTMDASATAPMIIQPPREGLENVSVGETWAIQTDLGGFSSGLFTGLGETNIAFYQAEIDPRAPSLESEIDASWLDQVSTPQEYHVAAWKELGRLPTPGTRSPSTLTPAVVHAIYAASLPQAMPLNDVGAGPFFEGALGASLTSITVELPYERTEYYYSTESDARWWNELWMHDEEYLQSIIIGWIPYTYEQGAETTTRWNQPVFSPVLPDRSDLLGDWGTRAGDVITISPPMYGDREKHAGFIANEGTTTLYRNGELVEEQPYGDFGSFEVPPERASYRVELQHSQKLFELTPRQSVAWTFESSHASEETPARLPLLVVRFAPTLDERGRAPSGAFTLPLYIDQFGQISSTLESAPSVEVSFDDGATWSTASLAVDGQRWNASLQHPASAAYVSLRTSARDLNGNAVEQTLIRAYAIRQPE